MKQFNTYIRWPWRMAFLCVPLVFATSMFASTITLPGATYNISFVNPALKYTQPGSYSDGISSASVSVVPNPAESITAHNPAITSNGNATYQGATISTLYYFEIIGGNPGDKVPILIQYMFRLSASGDGIQTFGQADAEISVCADRCAGSGGMDADIRKEVLTGTSASQTFFGPISLTETVGNVDSIGLGTLASAYAGDYHDPSGGSDASAYADPYIYVDPSFANAAKYSIVVSPGVGNSPLSTPEPASWLLMGGALIGVCWWAAMSSSSKPDAAQRYQWRS